MEASVSNMSCQLQMNKCLRQAPILDSLSESRPLLRLCKLSHVQNGARLQEKGLLDWCKCAGETCSSRFREQHANPACQYKIASSALRRRAASPIAHLHRSRHQLHQLRDHWHTDFPATDFPAADLAWGA